MTMKEMISLPTSFCEGEIIVQELSLFKHLPSAENIQALTDCEGWHIDYDRFQELYHSLKGYSEWGRSL